MKKLIVLLILAALAGWCMNSYATGTYISGSTSQQITVVMAGTADGDPCFSLDTTLNLYYWEEGEAAVVGPVNMTQATLGTYAADTAIEIFNGISGMYVIYVPNAAMDGGVGKKVQFFVTSDTADVRPAFLEIQLDTAPTAAVIADAVWDEVIEDHTGELTFGGELGGLDPNITAILADTDELQTDWANGGRLDLILDIINAGTSQGSVGRYAMMDSFMRPERYQKPI